MSRSNNLQDTEPELAFAMIAEKIFMGGFLGVKADFKTIGDKTYQIDRVCFWPKTYNELIVEIHADHNAKWHTDGRINKDADKREALLNSGCTILDIFCHNAEDIHRHAHYIRELIYRIMKDAKSTQPNKYYGLLLDGEDTTLSLKPGEI
jgi:hypothetical protein